MEDYIAYQNIEGVEYLIPGDSLINMQIQYDDLYQTARSLDSISGSIASINLISQEDLIYGAMPQNEYELVIDKMSLNNNLNSREQNAKMCGITKIEEFLNRKTKVSGRDELPEFKIVGISDTQSPSIYVQDKSLINMISLSENTNQEYGIMANGEDQNGEGILIVDYNLLLDKIELKKGRLPENDYEVIVNDTHSYEMPLNKTIKQTVNGTTLRVVGYYDSKYEMDYYLVNSNTVLYKTIKEKDGFMIASKNLDNTLNKFKEFGLNVKNGYQSSKDKYLEEKKDTIKNNLTVSGIILGISLIEIFLMIRSSFLSRIREIGILRAIGVKKKDIYKMFMGEIIAITTTASIPGIVLMSYILKVISTIKYFERLFIINIETVLLSVIFIYLFNLLVGLLPVFKVVRKTPAEILSRHDI